MFIRTRAKEIVIEKKLTFLRWSSVSKMIWFKVIIIFFVKYDQFRNNKKLKNSPVLWRRVIWLKIEIFGDLILIIFEHQINEISKISF
jgi:hypothetical protein